MVFCLKNRTYYLKEPINLLLRGREGKFAVHPSVLGLSMEPEKPCVQGGKFVMLLSESSLVLWGPVIRGSGVPIYGKI